MGVVCRRQRAMALGDGRIIVLVLAFFFSSAVIGIVWIRSVVAVEVLSLSLVLLRVRGVRRKGLIRNVGELPHGRFEGATCIPLKCMSARLPKVDGGRGGGRGAACAGRSPVIYRQQSFCLQAHFFIGRHRTRVRIAALCATGWTSRGRFAGIDGVGRLVRLGVEHGACP